MLVQDYVPLPAVLLAQARVAEVAQRDAQVVLTDAQAVLGVVVATVRVRVRQRVQQGVALDARAVLVIARQTVHHPAREFAQVVRGIVTKDAPVVVTAHAQVALTGARDVVIALEIALRPAKVIVGQDAQAVVVDAQAQAVARVAINAQVLVKAVVTILVNMAVWQVAQDVTLVAQTVVRDVLAIAKAVAKHRVRNLALVIVQAHVTTLVQAVARGALLDVPMGATVVRDVARHVLERAVLIAVAVVADAREVVRLDVQTVALMVATTVVRAVAQVLV